MATSTKMDASRLTQLLGSWSTGSGPLYRQLAEGIAALVDQGAVRDGAILPAERNLAETLAVSRSTVVAAFTTLREEGRIERRQGSGTRVTARQTPGPDRATLRSAPLFDRGEETRALLQTVPPCLLDLPAEFRALADEGPAVPDVVESEGWLPLREAIANRFSRAGLVTDPSQILITSGAQQASTLILSEVCRPGDVVLSESHTWPGLTDGAERLGARCHGVAMDGDGMIISELRAAIERLRPAAIVVNPHHHNPTGTRMTPARRRDLADTAADYGVLLIEDRVFAELAYDGVVAPPLAVHRPQAPIAVIDSFSKTVWSGLRIGWVRASADLIGRLRLVKAIDDLGSSVPSQLLAYRLLSRLDDLIDQRCSALAIRAESAHRLASDLFPDWSIPVPVGGAALWPSLPKPVVRPFVHHAARCGVLLAGDDLFAVSKRAGQSLRLPYTAAEDEFVNAVERLAEAWSSFDPATGPWTGAMTATTLV